jgi:hypothetical protein
MCGAWSLVPLTAGCALTPWRQLQACSRGRCCSHSACSLTPRAPCLCLLVPSLPVPPVFISSNYVMLQGLGGMPMGILRLVGLIIVRIKLRFLNKTSRDREAILASGSGAKQQPGRLGRGID